MITSKDEFVSTWKLVSMEMRRGDGEIVYPYGRDVVGTLNYDADGNMSVQLMRLDRPAFASGDSQKGTPEELKAAFEGYVAYFGTYEVNEEEGTVTHHLTGSIFPNWVGSNQIRFFELVGKRLTLKAPPIRLGGVMVTPQLAWERMK